MCDREARATMMEKNEMTKDGTVKGNYTSNNSKRTKNASDCRSEEEYNNMEEYLTGWINDL